MSSQQENPPASQYGKIQLVLNTVENAVEEMWKEKFKTATKPTPLEIYKSAAMAEISRKLMYRADEIERIYRDNITI